MDKVSIEFLLKRINSLEERLTALEGQVQEQSDKDKHIAAKHLKQI